MSWRRIPEDFSECPASRDLARCMPIWSAALACVAGENVRKTGALYRMLELAALPSIFLFPPDFGHRQRAMCSIPGLDVERLPEILERCSQIGNVVLICIGNLRAACCCVPKNRLKCNLAEYYAVCKRFCLGNEGGYVLCLKTALRN